MSFKLPSSYGCFLHRRGNVDTFMLCGKAGQIERFASSPNLPQDFPLSLWSASPTPTNIRVSMAELMYNQTAARRSTTSPYTAIGDAVTF